MWKRGQWLAVCDVCGWEFLSGELRERWDGLMVDKACWETRHPQEFIKAVKESTIPWARPEPTDVFVSEEYVETLYYSLSDPVNNLPGEYTNRLGIN